MRPFTDADDPERYFLELALERYADGDDSALLEVAEWAMYRDELVPDAAARAFGHARAKWETAHTRTLDEAFGLERPKGWRQHDARRWGKAGAVYLEVKRINEREGVPIGPDLFERAGAAYAVSRTTASEMYYSVKKHLEQTSE